MIYGYFSFFIVNGDILKLNSFQVLRAIFIIMIVSGHSAVLTET